MQSEWIIALPLFAISIFILITVLTIFVYLKHKHKVIKHRPQSTKKQHGRQHSKIKNKIVPHVSSAQSLSQYSVHTILSSNLNTPKIEWNTEVPLSTTVAMNTGNPLPPLRFTQGKGISTIPSGSKISPKPYYSSFVKPPIKYNDNKLPTVESAQGSQQPSYLILKSSLPLLPFSQAPGVPFLGPTKQSSNPRRCSFTSISLRESISTLKSSKSDSILVTKSDIFSLEDQLPAGEKTYPDGQESMLNDESNVSSSVLDENRKASER